MFIAKKCHLITSAKKSSEFGLGYHVIKRKSRVLLLGDRG